MEAPSVFPFPFEPYQIQKDFMRNLFLCLEAGKLGIFESPTGTGKSLSLICGSLTWLREHEAYEKSKLEEGIKQLEASRESGEESTKTLNEPAWFAEAKKNSINTQKKNQLKEQLAKITSKEEKILKLRERAKSALKSIKDSEKKAGVRSGNYENHAKRDRDQPVTQDDEDDALIEDPKSDDSESDGEEKIEDQEEDVKIIFASRTHSQISQFVREVEKSPFGKEVRVCSLASRQQMCINESVTGLKNSNLINERCLEMQRKKSSSATSKSEEGRTVKKAKKTAGTSTCPYLNSERIQDIRDVSLVDVLDVESLVQMGRQHRACPYYSSRSALSDAQLIVVPYSTLLHRPTREACGLKLKNSVVIIDEAHNLLETISSIHNVQVGGHFLSHAHWQLSQYQQRYSTRLSARNLLHIKQLLFLLSCLQKTLATGPKAKEGAGEIRAKEEEKIWPVIDFIVQAGFDHLNLHKIVEFCEKSRLAQKLASFKAAVSVDQQDAARHPPAVGGLRSFLNKLKSEDTAATEAPAEPQDGNQKQEAPMPASPLMLVLDFLRCLRNPGQDGRILCVRQARPSKSYLKYLLLNPASLFSDLIEQPRAVVVAGGTMQPLWEFRYQLFGAAGASQDRITSFSCGHVIPPDHILPIALTRGPSNKELDFSWAQRAKLLDELNQLLFNLSQVVFGGLVCFLPSYDFEKQVYDHLIRSGTALKIEKVKKLFREPKKANQVDQTLAEYAQCIRLASANPVNRGAGGTKTGALLLCVVGGKLSEGINFSDDLARCVVVVGLPYANSKSAELKEKMDYLNQTASQLRPEGENRSPGQLHYESLCFKAVNQSIGRAIRHRNDYAALVLADSRYARPSSQASLPAWISQRLTVVEKFGQSLASIRKFLVERSKSQTSS